MLNINLQSEYILSVCGIALTNTFLTSVLVMFLLSGGAILFYRSRQDHHNIFINALRILVVELLQLADLVTQDRSWSQRILPLIATFFLFIVSANLLALFPGFLGSLFIKTARGEFALLRSPNSDLTTTAALALFAVMAIQVFSLRALGIKSYIRRFFNLTNPLQFILGFFELLSEGVKILSFSFRLFGNIFAGEVLLLVIAFLIPYLIPVPFMILEVFVGIVQAFIFAMLTLTFIKTSTLPQLHNAPARKHGSSRKGGGKKY